MPADGGRDGVPDSDSCNNRTHEPNLRELTAELDGLRDLLTAELRAVRDLADERERRLEERDRRYEERFKGSDKLNEVVTLSADKAIAKAEKAQEDYNKFHNELGRKMEAERSDFAEKATVNDKFKDAEKDRDVMRKEIVSLRESRSEGGGRRLQSEWFVVLAGLLIAAALVFLAVKRGA